MEMNQSEKKSNKDLTSNDEITIKNRLYLFFFYALKKRDITFFLSTVFMVFETIQLVSFAFSEPVKNKKDFLNFFFLQIF